MRIKIGINGASGRMGSALVSLLSEFQQYQLMAALESANSKCLNQICLYGQLNHGAEVRYSSDIEAAMQQCDAFIDFSTPEGSLALVSQCAKYGKAALIGTTGHTAEMVQRIKEAAQHAPILFTANTSIGIYALMELSKLANKILGDEFQIEIMELHHNKKKDSPSGTALSLARVLSQAGQHELVLDRSGTHSLRGGSEIGVVGLRGGDSPGEHTLFFLGEGERIELTHRVRDRSVFARGALKLLEKVIPLPAGLYSMQDILK